MRRLFFGFLSILIIPITIASQSIKDTSKTSYASGDETKKYGIKLAEHNQNHNEQIDISNSFLKVPLNLKVYQKILLFELNVNHHLTSEDLATGMTDTELDAFDNNKKLTQRMLADTYGEDIINERKLLAALGITEDQIRMLAAVLKWFILTPHL
jgi:hypothetical protein